MRTIVLCAAAAALSMPVWAADNNNVDPAEIIRKFAARESEFAEARNNYTYRQTVKLQVLDSGGNPTDEKWDLIEDVIFSPVTGKRIEKVVYAPVSTLRSIMVSPEDEQDLRHVQPFVLTTEQIPEYQLDYLGREKVDDIGCYVFSAKPKKLEAGKRYFEGQIWVDDRDLQIVKTYGKATGLLKKGTDQQFPKFETYREQIDGKYWFPTYTRADDTLHFKDQDVRIRMIVKYQDYKFFAGRSTIRYGDVVEDQPATTPPPAKKP